MRAGRAVPQAAQMRRLEQAVAGRPAPLAVVDLDAFDANAEALQTRASGTPIRLATKSIRCRALLERALAHAGFHGLLAYSLTEALWLARLDPPLPGDPDILVAYPCVDAATLRDFAGDPRARERIALVVDHADHLRLIEEALPAGARARVWLDVDASLRLGRAHIGARRSPLHAVDEVVQAARAVAASPQLDLGGLMFYDAQIAGVADASPLVHAVQARSARELAGRRARTVAAVSEVVPVPEVNAGGTGSLHVMALAPDVTELAAGSGLLGPHLFDGYRAFRPRPATFYACDVVRTPAPGLATVFSGGYAASGAAGDSRSPMPWWPAGLRLLRSEGAGEVQTPLRGGRGGAPRIGERVWFRHAKAGELFERFSHVHLVQDDAVLEVAPTYRGEGRCFG